MAGEMAHNDKNSSSNSSNSSIDDEKVLSIFASLDVDHGGFLSMAELEIGMRALGVAPSQASLELLFRKIDLDTDGRIQLSEFKFFYSKRKEELRAVFDKLDANVDGKITSAEFAAAIERVNMKVSSNQLRDIMSRFDTSNSGRISFEEFCNALLLLPTVNPEAVFDAFVNATPLEVAQGEYNLPKDNPKDLGPKSKKSMLVEIGHQLYYGGVAGIASRTATAPIDRLKVILQAAAPGSKSLGMMQILGDMYRQGGVRGFFRGNFINCLKIAPETAIKFLLFDEIKKYIAADPGNVTVAERFVSGGLAGSLTQMSIYPLEILKTRLGICKPGTYSGIGNCLATIIKTEGPAAMYKGCLASVAGIIPYAGIDLMTNSILKDYATAYYKGQGQEPGVAVVIGSGMASSSLGMVITYPLNLVRTRLQASGMPGVVAYSGFMDCLKKAVELDGIAGLYKGMVPNLLKVMPAASISYTVYDLLSKSSTK